MALARTSAAGLAVAALLVGGTLAGCGKDEKAASETSSAASSSAESSTDETTTSETQANDYSELLIAPADVSPDATTPGPPQLNPSGNPGVGQVFVSPDGASRVIDTILVFPDVATADSNFASNQATLNEIVTGTPEPLDVGTNGVIATGTSPDGTKSVTVVMFSEGKALVHLSFEGPPGDDVPKDVATDIAQKQDEAVKAGLSE